MPRFLLTLTPALAALALAAPPVAAEQSLVETESFNLRLGGYAGSFSSYQWTGYDTAGLTPEHTGVNAGVLRLEWKAGLTDNVALDVQNRFFWNIAPSASASTGLVGLGSTVPPQRTVDLRSVLVDEPGVLVEHDVDRLALSFFTPVADVTVGRQAVTWGNSSLFTVADLWTQFSPFELDTSQKRGVDALRVLGYPADGLEVEAIVVDRGDLENLSGGARAAWTLDRGDYYLGAGRNYDTVWGLMGFAVDLDDFRGHSEIALPYSEDRHQLDAPRLTVGIDYFSTRVTALLEYHFNGPGVVDPAQYLTALSSDAVARGERYFVGKHYVGATVAYLPWADLVTLSLTGIANVTDPSLLVSPALMYAISQNVTASLGAYVGVGEEPAFDLTSPTPVTIGSEFGLYPNVIFLQLAGFI